jgi:hypothetical protein
VRTDEMKITNVGFSGVGKRTWFSVNPWVVVLLWVVGMLLYSNWRTAKILHAKYETEHALRLGQADMMQNAFFSCQPSVYLNSTNPVDAIASLRYRDATNGRGCVFLSDGRYGNLWWSMIVETKTKAHLEWQFAEMGHYKW